MTVGLDLRYLDAFVSLDMRTKANFVAMRDVAHPRGVASNAGDVEQETRRAQIVHS